MAKVSKTKQSKTKIIKKQQTVRERTQSSADSRPKRLRQKAGSFGGRIKRVSSVGKKEYHVIPLPDNKIGRFLSKRGRLVPRFVSEAWAEIKQVTWPNARETIRLTMAVFIFAVIFATIVGILDYGLDKLFREVIVGK